MRVLLIYSNNLTDLQPAPPIGLSYVATHTEKAGHHVKSLDLSITNETNKELTNSIAQFRPEVIGLSVRNIDNLIHQNLNTHNYYLENIINIIRDQSRAYIVLGGPAISILGKQALARFDADFTITGEGEISFPELLNALSGKKQFHHIHGLCYRQRNEIIVVPPCESATFSESGMDKWINWKQYQQLGATWPIQSKRGCPLKCSYCAYSLVEGRHVRKRDPKDVVDEIVRINNIIRPRCFEFIDSTFNLPQHHAMGICEEIIRRDLKINLTAMGINPLSISRELFSIMHRAGFRSMMLTPEHSNNNILNSLNKGFDHEHVINAALLAKRSGIASMWFFMLGGPGESKSTVDEALLFIKKYLNWPDSLVMITTGIRVLPQTSLAELSVKQGLLDPNHDLSEPFFYFSNKVSEYWILRRINNLIVSQPNVVHAAEDGHSTSRRITDRLNFAYNLLGVSPPYWRLLPPILRMQAMRRLRMESISVHRPIS